VASVVGVRVDESRYRQAERELWNAVGVKPDERSVHLEHLGADIRVQEVGDGPPVLFLHGAPNAGSTWAVLAAQLPGFRLLLADRPGAGLSSPLARPVTLASVPGFADRFAVDLLDALGVERADVVASSFGGYLALRAAARHPERFGRMVQLGCPAFVPGMRTPAMLRALASPMRHLICRLPADPRGATMALRQIGHGHALAAGTIPPALLAWNVAMQGHTATMTHDSAMIAQLASPWRGAHPSLTLPPELLGSVRCPTTVIWGADDPFGDVQVGEALVASLADAELHVLPHAGHLPWLDGPGRCADLIRARFDRPA
jgi:2-hydroxy-6-oxo-octa-2,4-dienoate hydrolase